MIIREGDIKGRGISLVVVKIWKWREKLNKIGNMKDFCGVMKVFFILVIVVIILKFYCF